MPIVPCPHCRAENDVPAGNSPFFCRSCHAIVDRTGTLRQAPTSVPAAAAAPRKPFGDTDRAPAPKTSTSGPGSINYHVPSGPGAGFSVGGSRVVGFVLAAVAAAVVGGGLAYLGAYVLRIPLLYAFIAGWAIRRALATGAGGGTPDRGVVGGIFLAALAFGTCVAARYGEYLANSARESRHYAEIYGPSPSVTLATTGAAHHILDLDADADGNGTTSTGRTFSVAQEVQHLATAKATGVVPVDPYGIYLLAVTGHDGFVGQVRHVVAAGEDVRLLPSGPGFHVPGVGLALLWLLEFLIVLITAFARID